MNARLPMRAGRELPRTFSDLQRQVDNVFQGLWAADAAPSRSEGYFLPPMNVVELEDVFEITVELPGVQPENVNIEIDNGFLTISGEKRDERTEEGSAWRRVERTFGSFQRAVKLGAGVDATRVSAEAKDGILTIRAGKAEAAKARKIQVVSAGAHSLDTAVRTTDEPSNPT